MFTSLGFEALNVVTKLAEQRVGARYAADLVFTAKVSSHAEQHRHADEHGDDNQAAHQFAHSSGVHDRSLEPLLGFIIAVGAQERRQDKTKARTEAQTTNGDANGEEAWHVN